MLVNEFVFLFTSPGETLLMNFNAGSHATINFLHLFNLEDTRIYFFFV